MLKKLCFLFILLFSIGSYSQDKDISAQLQAIDRGDIENARSGLKKLKTLDPGNPSVIYLDALLTRDGKEAVAKFENVVEKYPDSKYADASLFRIYSYYYALGLYNTAQKFYDKLKNNYPSSVYLTPSEEIKGPLNSDQQDYTEDLPEEKQIPESQKENPEPEKVYKYTIQAGAFLVHSNAVKLSDTFQKSGYFSEIKDKKVGGSTFSIVFLGKFETESEAKIFLEDINKREKLPGKVVHIE